ncbi:MAG TPA: serine/threonine-protein kinase [Gemmatales bacterium]|nr:serine/threonine-protein kinase [Gemmatales bacterium]
MKLPISPELLIALTGQSAARLKRMLSALPHEQVTELSSLCQFFQDQELLTSYQVSHIVAGQGEGLVVGQYLVLNELGRGGFGMVYTARHRMMGRLAALKIFTPETDESETHVRFLREIQATAQLDHPNLIKAYEAGELYGSIFLAMELVDGQNLQEKVIQQGPMPLDVALHCHIDAAVGLAYAHSLGMIHRDVKPGNIMLGKDGRVRVLDLGLVKFMKGFTSMATSMDGSVRGTAAYMAPEQAISIRNADHRSDIYSLGSSLYFVLTGQPMYPEKTIMQQLLAHQKKAIPSLLTTLPDIPPYLDQLYQRMVAKEPKDRPQSMQLVIDGLRAVQEGTTPPPLAPVPAPPSTSAPKPDSKESTVPAWKRLFPFWREKQ